MASLTGFWDIFFKERIFLFQTIRLKSDLDGRVLPECLDVDSVLPDLQLAGLLVGLQLPQLGGRVDQGGVQVLRHLLQQEAEALDHVAQDFSSGE